MLVGRIWQDNIEGHTLWGASCEALGAWTQGNSRAEACDMLRSLIELQVDRKGFKASVAELGKNADGSIRVLVDANDLAVLAAAVLKHQRERNHLTVAEVAKRLGSSSHTAYAAYERAEREPSLSKFRELLAAVGAEVFELSLVTGARKPAKSARARAPKASTKRRAG